MHVNYATLEPQCVCVTLYKYICKDAPSDALNDDHFLTESYRFKINSKAGLLGPETGGTNFIVDSTTVDRQRRLLTTMVVVGGSTHGGHVSSVCVTP